MFWQAQNSYVHFWNSKRSNLNDLKRFGNPVELFFFFFGWVRPGVYNVATSMSEAWLFQMARVALVFSVGSFWGYTRETSCQLANLPGCVALKGCELLGHRQLLGLKLHLAKKKSQEKRLAWESLKPCCEPLRFCRALEDLNLSMLMQLLAQEHPSFHQLASRCDRFLAWPNTKDPGRLG